MKTRIKKILVWVVWGVVVVLGVWFWRVPVVIAVWIGGMWIWGKMSGPG